jgi:RNA polymerase sigma-70 factor (ECF subfamily)
MTFNEELVASLPRLKITARKWAGSEWEDLYQETLAAALRKQEGYTLGTNMNAWLSTICHNEWVNGIRRAKRWLTVGIDDCDELPHSDDQHVVLEFKDTIRALSSLPVEQRRAVVASAIGIEHPQQAAELGVPIGTIKSRTSRGRAALAELTSRNAATRGL